MVKRFLDIGCQYLPYCLTALLLSVLPLPLQASLIENTIGTAVVNDATAVYYNPAALTLLKRPQAIALGSLVYFNTRFDGKLTLPAIGLNQSGNSQTKTEYFLPAFYFAFPATERIYLGIAIISNYFHKDISDDAFLRFLQASDSVTNIDFVSAFGVKLTENFAIGGSFNFTSVDFLLEPIVKFPNLDTPENKSRNVSSGYSWEGDIGLIVKPTKSTLIGLNYRLGVCYQVYGTSILLNNPRISSDNYRYKFWTPPRAVLSINQNITTNLGLIGTLQYIEWHVTDTMNFQNIATVVGTQAVIRNTKLPIHLRNGWVATLGAHYRPISAWVVRLAGTYNQSPANGFYQISTGDSFILGFSTGYNFSKCFTLDLGYGHAFMKNKAIHLARNGNFVTGRNQATRDSFSMKLIFNG